MSRAQLIHAGESPIRIARWAAAQVLVVCGMLATALPARANENVCKSLLNSTALVASPVVGGYELGSGALIDANQRLMVTAGHVVGDKLNVLVFVPQMGLDGQLITRRSYYLQNQQRLAIPARVLVRDARRDVAIIQLERIPQGFAAMPLAERSVLRGEQVYGIGNSGIDDDDSLWCFRDGSVRQICHKQLLTADGAINAMMFETTIASNHGDSGGPLANARGELVGITITHHADGKEHDMGQHVGYCTDISEIRTVLRGLNLQAPAAQARSAVFSAGRAFCVTDSRLPYEWTQVNLSTRLLISGCRGQQYEVVFVIADTHGRPVHDVNGEIRSRIAIRPGYDAADYSPEVLRTGFTLGTLHRLFGPGPVRCTFLVNVRDVETGAWMLPRSYTINYVEPGVTIDLP